MAVAATSQILIDGPRALVMHFTGVGDGAGDENNVVKVDVSQLVPKAKRLRIVKISGSSTGGAVKITWDGLIPVPIVIVDGYGPDDQFEATSGIVQPPGSTDLTGNISFSTIGFSLNSTYDITLEMVKKYQA